MPASLARAAFAATCAAASLLSATGALGAGPTPVDPLFREYENGPARLAGLPHHAGDQVWFDCRVAAYARAGEEPDQSFSLSWTWRALDAQGRLLVPARTGKLAAGLAPEDKDYRPRLRFDFQLPLLLLPGEYTIELAVVDEVAKAENKARFPVTVEGRPVEADAAELSATQIRFLRAEDDRRPLEDVVYPPGAAVFVRFDAVGFQHGEGNKIDLSYGVLILGPSGQPFLRDDPAVRHTASSFYPQFYVPAALRVQLPPKATPGEYIVMITLRDQISGKTAAARTAFRVE